MHAKVSSVRFFPLKGAQGWQHRLLEVNTKVGVVNDRRFALRKNPGTMSRRPEPFSKLDYYVCANTPVMATQLPDAFITEGGYEPKPAGVDRIARNIGIEPSVQLQDTAGKYHLCDTKGPMVSFLNLATVDELSKVMNARVDPDRFRMNVCIRGLPPFVEYEWVDGYHGTRVIEVGNVHLRIDDACERCAAPEVNPQTGERDMRISKGLRELMGARNYVSPHRGVQTVMGIYGLVLNDGIIEVGDEIKVL